MPARKFQSLKRDHSSSDVGTRRGTNSTSVVSIAQARPFLFRLVHRSEQCFALLSVVSIAQARPFLFRLKIWYYLLVPERVSIAQARPFLFRPASETVPVALLPLFQSLKRDHSSSDPAHVPGDRAPHRDVSIAQARPFLFRQKAVLVTSAKLLGFNRSSATIPLPTPGSLRPLLRPGYERVCERVLLWMYYSMSFGVFSRGGLGR